LTESSWRSHHTDCKFSRVSGNKLVQKYIDEGSRMVCEHAPSIIFMDEIDLIGSS
jgi:26S proteasome regulatory subunit T6